MCHGSARCVVSILCASAVMFPLQLFYALQNIHTVQVYGLAFPRTPNDPAGHGQRADHAAGPWFVLGIPSFQVSDLRLCDMMYHVVHDAKSSCQVTHTQTKAKQAESEMPPEQLPAAIYTCFQDET